MGHSRAQQGPQQSERAGDVEASHDAVALLTAVGEFCRSLACSADLSTVLSAILRRLLDSFEQADGGTLFLYQAGRERLVAECATGYDEDMARRVSLRSGESIAGKVYQSGRTTLYTSPQQLTEAMADTAPANRLWLEKAWGGRRLPHCALAIPLWWCDLKLGAIVLEIWRREARFSASDLQLAEALAPILGLMADRAALEQEVGHHRETLEQASRLQQDVMATLSHEMRTPLASIKGYASALLLHEVQWETQTQREYLETIVEESDKLSELIADLLETSIIDAGRLKIEKEPTRLPCLAQDVVDELQRHSDRHHFLVSFPSGFPIVDADAGRMRRVLFNLLDNAVKYSPGGGLVVIRGEVGESEVVVSVADQGQGIAPEHLNRLFERFFRVKFVAGEHVVGSGLGLPIAHSIVHAHDGRIWAESTLGQGTTVYFTLPLAGLSAGIGGPSD